MANNRQDAEQDQARRIEIGVEAWRRLVQDARALGAYGKIHVVGFLEDGRLTHVTESCERTHK